MSELIDLYDSNAEKACNVILPAIGSVSGLITAEALRALAVASGGTVLLVLGGALLGVVVAKVACGYIVEKGRERLQASAGGGNAENLSHSLRFVSASGFAEFRKSLQPYRNVSESEAKILASVAYHHLSISGVDRIAPQSCIGPAEMSKQIGNVLAAYAQKSGARA